MADQLGCQTHVVRSATPGDHEKCGHLAGQHHHGPKIPGPRGACLIADCGCPTYTPPAGQSPAPGLVTRVPVGDFPNPAEITDRPAPDDHEGQG